MEEEKEEIKEPIMAFESPLSWSVSYFSTESVGPQV